MQQGPSQPFGMTQSRQPVAAERTAIRMDLNKKLDKAAEQQSRHSVHPPSFERSALPPDVGAHGAPRPWRIATATTTGGFHSERHSGSPPAQQKPSSYRSTSLEHAARPSPKVTLSRE